MTVISNYVVVLFSLAALTFPVWLTWLLLKLYKHWGIIEEVDFMDPDEKSGLHNFLVGFIGLWALGGFFIIMPALASGDDRVTMAAAIVWLAINLWRPVTATLRHYLRTHMLCQECGERIKQ